MAAPWFALLMAQGCSSSEGAGGTDGTGGVGGFVGSGGFGGSSGFGGTGGAGGKTPPRMAFDIVFDSGSETIGSAEYQMDVVVGGPVGKGTARSEQFVLEYYIPTNAER